MVPLTISAPTTIPISFIIFLLKNSDLSGCVSVGGPGKGEGGDLPESATSIGGCKDADPSDIDSSEGLHPSDNKKS
jgi:hypothetical protein